MMGSSTDRSWATTRALGVRRDRRPTLPYWGLRLCEAVMLLLRVLLRYRRPPLPVPAAGFFTSSGSNATAPPPHLGAEGPRNEPGQEGSLARRVERAASVGAAMRGWMTDGRAVHRGHVFHAINRFRRHRLHRTALQVPPFPHFASASS